MGSLVGCMQCSIRPLPHIFLGLESNEMVLCRHPDFKLKGLFSAADHSLSQLFIETRFNARQAIHQGSKQAHTHSNESYPEFALLS